MMEIISKSPLDNELHIEYTDMWDEQIKGSGGSFLEYMTF